MGRLFFPTSIFTAVLLQEIRAKAWGEGAQFPFTSAGLCWLRIWGWNMTKAQQMPALDMKAPGSKSLGQERAGLCQTHQPFTFTFTITITSTMGSQARLDALGAAWPGGRCPWQGVEGDEL